RLGAGSASGSSRSGRSHCSAKGAAWWRRRGRRRRPSRSERPVAFLRRWARSRHSSIRTRFSSAPPPSPHDRAVTSGVIDLNADVGESFGTYRIGDDEELIPSLTSVSVAGGLHAGDPRIIARTVARAEGFGVAVGAHPGYPDLAGFGRRDMDLGPAELRDVLLYQVGAVAAFTKGHGLQHVKPHGAMYNRAARDQAQAEAIVDALLHYDERLI